MYNDDNQSYNMKRKKNFKYQVPAVAKARLETEGTILSTSISMDPTVDEAKNMNADESFSEASYLEF